MRPHSFVLVMTNHLLLAKVLGKENHAKKLMVAFGSPTVKVGDAARNAHPYPTKKIHAFNKVAPGRMAVVTNYFPFP